MSGEATIGIDLAKNVFSVHAVAADGRVLMRRQVSRAKLLETVANLPKAVIGMEACAGSHDWGHKMQALGHTVRLMAPKFVAPYRKGGKNDGNDAEAICEAVRRPNMRFVPMKSAEQRAMLTLHRVRQGFVVERTATGNRVRALLTEFGLVLAQGLSNLRHGVPQCIETLPDIAQRAARDLYDHLKVLDARIAEYDRELTRLARLDETTRRVQTIPGIGPITASAVVATIGSAHEFRNGREFVSWLGLVPRQWSTGGKTRLGHISRWGDVYLRHLLVMGARAVLQMAGKHDDRLSRWASAVKQRRGHNRAMVALAAKNARILWAVLSKGEPFQVARAAA
jgi:transposase